MRNVCCLYLLSFLAFLLCSDCYAGLLLLKNMQSVVLSCAVNEYKNYELSFKCISQPWFCCVITAPNTFDLNNPVGLTLSREFTRMFRSVCF